MGINKAVIPTAGLGTRMLPAAKAVPKELLPILDRPTIQYVVEEAAGAGISDALLITSPEKPAIKEHFAPKASLEKRLKTSGKDDLLASINRLIQQVRISTVDQPEQHGLGDAVRHARAFAGADPFLCLLGDTIFSGPSPSAQLVEAYNSLGTAVIGLEEVPPEKVSRYGIVGGKRISEELLKLDTLVEKPTLQSAPSRLAIAARYILTPTIFACLDEVTPGALGEIQLTDALRLMLDREPIHGVILRGKRHDIGNPIDWLKTNIIFAASDAKMWEQIEPMVRSLLEKDFRQG